MNNILILAPHADDEILGCGGSISFYKSRGYKVYISIMTNANKGSPEKYSKNLMHKIRNEALKSHKFLKVSETFFFDFPAPE